MAAMSLIGQQPAFAASGFRVGSKDFLE